jgi:HK97 gp10 family phage protein
MFEFQADGLKDAVQKFGKKFTPAMQRDVLLAGAKVLRKAVVAAAPRRTGNLARSIYARASDSSDPVSAKVAAAIPSRKKLGSAKGGEYYARFLEGGTQKMSAQPFVAPALAREHDAVMDAIRLRLVKKLGEG